MVRCGIAYFGLLCLWQCYGLLAGVVVIWCLGWVWVVVAWLLTGDFVWCLMIVVLISVLVLLVQVLGG